MTRAKKSQSEPLPQSYPALTDEEYENRLIALSYAQAERQLREGTAPAPVVVHFLKAGSQKEKAENEILRKQLEVMDAKVRSLEAATNSDASLQAAIAAFTSYRSNADD